MSKTTLGEVVQRVNQLSVEDRLRLFDQVVRADGIDESSRLSHPYSEGRPADSLKVGKFEVARNEGTFSVSYSENAVAILLDSRYIFQVFFYPENLRESRLQLRRKALPPPSDQAKNEIRTASIARGYHPSDQSIIEQYYLNEPGSDGDTIGLVDAEAFVVSEEIIRLLPKLSWMLCNAALELGAMAFRDLHGTTRDECPEFSPEEIYNFRVRTKAKDIEEVVDHFVGEMKAYFGITQGGARERKRDFGWDPEKALAFYHAVESMPRIGDKPIWEYAREQLSDNDYDSDTIVWLRSRPAFVNVPEGLLKDAAEIWKQYEDKWESLPAKHSPQAYAFRHACHQLNYPGYSYNTLRTKFYQGRKMHHAQDLPF